MFGGDAGPGTVGCKSAERSGAGTRNEPVVDGARTQADGPASRKRSPRSAPFDLARITAIGAGATPVEVIGRRTAESVREGSDQMLTGDQILAQAADRIDRMGFAGFSDEEITRVLDQMALRRQRSGRRDGRTPWLSRPSGPERSFGRHDAAGRSGTSATTAPDNSDDVDSSPEAIAAALAHLGAYAGDADHAEPSQEPNHEDDGTPEPGGATMPIRAKAGDGSDVQSWSESDRISRRPPAATTARHDGKADTADFTGLGPTPGWIDDESDDGSPETWTDTIPQWETTAGVPGEVDSASDHVRTGTTSFAVASAQHRAEATAPNARPENNGPAEDVGLEETDLDWRETATPPAAQPDWDSAGTARQSDDTQANGPTEHQSADETINDWLFADSRRLTPGHTDTSGDTTARPDPIEPLLLTRDSNPTLHGDRLTDATARGSSALHRLAHPAVILPALALGSGAVGVMVWTIGWGGPAPSGATDSWPRARVTVDYATVTAPNRTPSTGPRPLSDRTGGGAPAASHASDLDWLLGPLDFGMVPLRGHGWVPASDQDQPPTDTQARHSRAPASAANPIGKKGTDSRDLVRSGIGSQTAVADAATVAYDVQVASFLDAANARSLGQRLTEQGYSIRIVRWTDPRARAWHVVQSHGYDSRPEAENAALRLAESLDLQPIVRSP